MNSRGFTLVEVLVALGVFAVAVLGLMSAQTTSLVTAGALDARAYSDIAADNVMVRTMIEPGPLELGFTSGNEDIGSRRFRWSRHVRPSGRGDIVAITINVHASDSDQVLTSLTAFQGNR